MTHVKHIAFLVAFGGVILWTPALAARLYVSPEEVSAGASCRVGVFIQSAENEVLNAVEGRISYPDFISPSDINYGDSALTLWVESPTVSSSKIEFSGITPGGFTGDRKLFDFVCLSSGQGVGRFEFLSGAAYLHDGSGTPANMTLNGADVRSETSSTNIQLTPSDRKPPEIFQPQIIMDNGLNNGAPTLIFNAQDKESGIAYYEILASGVWVRAASPYLLPDGFSQGPVFVRAVDNAGNFIMVPVSTSSPALPANTPNSTRMYIYFAASGVLLFVIICLIVRAFVSYRRRSS